MDLEMPVMDGLTCARKIRQLERDGDIVRHVPIIAVTANARLEQINTAVEAGMVCQRRINPGQYAKTPTGRRRIQALSDTRTDSKDRAAGCQV